VTILRVTIRRPCWRIAIEVYQLATECRRSAGPDELVARSLMHDAANANATAAGARASGCTAYSGTSAGTRYAAATSANQQQA
jgi:hypothetical protein